jgi:hypothetical protein
MWHPFIFKQGYTEITIVPTSSELRTLHLHSRQCSKSQQVIPCILSTLLFSYP